MDHALPFILALIVVILIPLLIQAVYDVTAGQEARPGIVVVTADALGTAVALAALGVADLRRK